MRTEILPQSVAMIVLDPNGVVCGINWAAKELLGDNVVDFINNWEHDKSVIDFNHQSIRVDSLKTDQATYLMLFDDGMNGADEEETRPTPRQAPRVTEAPPDTSAAKGQRDLLNVKAKSTAMIAHQFGTPISAVRLKSYLLKKHLDSLSKERITEHLEQIEVQLDQMVDLLDDLLLINQLYSSDPVIPLSPINLEAFSKKVIHQVAFDWEGRDVKAIFSGRMNNVQLDRRLVRYVLSHLVGNVLEYTGSTVRVNVRRHENSVTFSVSAPSIVIPAYELESLFSPHYRANSGMGLGLSIMKTCVEMYSGTITVESQADTGTTFVVRLPCRDA